MKLFGEKLTRKGRVIITLLILVILVGGSTVAYNVHDFTENNPKFCVSCHLMQKAYNAWAKSVHSNVTCHECHYATPAEQNRMLLMTILKRPQSVSPRHGKVVVPWKMCFKCHWEKEPGYENAPNIAKSRGHAKHVFIEQIECSKCHGYIKNSKNKAGLHEFLPSDRFCLKCHEGKKVHGLGMTGLACLACHTDKTKDIRPNRDKCLTCHGDPETRARIALEPKTTDTRHFTPTEKMIKKASNLGVTFPPGAPMAFECYTCHKPHTKVKPDQSDCFKCHREIKKVGRHDLHINVVGVACIMCHKPHEWKITKAAAKETCTQCHGYKNPDDFLK
jgi:predicted CXXCH cytochrome family protein